MISPLNTYEQKAESILFHNKYMVVSTSDGEGNPWGAVVFYVFDEKYNFYFLSAMDSLHAKNAMETHKVSLVIFDSTVPLGSYDEVQVEGKISAISGPELKKAIDLYCKKLFPGSTVPSTERYKPSDYGEGAEFRFFRVSILKAFTTGPDRGVQVSLARK